MQAIRIFRHVDCEGPGYLLDVLQQRGIAYEMVLIDEDASIPIDLDVSALVFMGGGMSVNDELPWIEQELSIIRRAHEKGIPMLGHCLGAQLISKALGGKVVKNSQTEIGWFPVCKHAPIEGSVTQDWLSELDDCFEVFHWHGEMFTLPPGSNLILENTNCPHQGFVIGKTLALQCHIEMTEAMILSWTNRFSDQLTSDEVTVQSRAEIERDLENRISSLNVIADKIYDVWLRGLS